MTAQNTNQKGPKTAFGKFMVYKFIPQYANNVYGLVYLGAAILIIIVGLRGLGAQAGKIAIVPGFLIGPDNKIIVDFVMGALFLEFFLLLVMAVTTFFTPEEDMGAGGHEVEDTGKKPTAKITLDVATFQAELEHLQNMTNEELKVIEGYVNRMVENAKRVNMAKQEFFKALVEMKQNFKS